MQDYEAYCESPIGLVAIGGTDEAITVLDFVEQRRADAVASDVVRAAQRQIEAYFASERPTFDVPIAPRGTAFQQAVWQRLLEIPYGVTESYRDVAESIGRARAVRAVGAANGANPIALIVPCHRVIGSDGNLTGYGGGLWRKEWLLEFEGVLLL